MTTFRNLAAAAALAVATAPSAPAQPLTAVIDEASAARFNCPGGTATATTIRCCLAILDDGVLSDPNASQEQLAAARAFESSLLAALKTMNAPEEPRTCPLPVSFPPILGASSSLPAPGPIGPIGRRPPGPGPGPTPLGGFFSFPRVALGFGVGTLADDFDTDVPVGGYFQRFPGLAGSDGAFDVRLAYLLALATTSDDPEVRRLTAPLLGVFVGYSLIRGHVDEYTNIGGPFDGITNTAFEGTTEVRRPYLGLGLTLPFGAGFSGSTPLLAFYFGATIGYSFLELTDDNGPFRYDREGTDVGIETGIDISVADGWTLRPGISHVFDPADGGGDPLTTFNLNVFRQF